MTLAWLAGSWRRWVLVRTLAPFLIAGCLLLAPPVRAQVVVAAVNENATIEGSGLTTWAGNDVGWFFTPTTNLIVNGVQTRFASIPLSRTLTAGIYTAVGVTSESLNG